MAQFMQEQEAFRVCDTLLASGCKTNREMEKGLYRTLWWISPLEAERTVKRWIQTQYVPSKQKIDSKHVHLNTHHKTL